MERIPTWEPGALNPHLSARGSRSCVTWAGSLASLSLGSLVDKMGMVFGSTSQSGAGVRMKGLWELPGVVSHQNTLGVIVRLTFSIWRRRGLDSVASEIPVGWHNGMAVSLGKAEGERSGFMDGREAMRRVRKRVRSR